MDAKITGILGYISWVGWLVAFLAGDKEGAKFHLNQSLVLLICMTVLPVLSAVAGLIPVIGFIVRIAAGICSLALFILWIMGLIAACKEEEKELPIIGSIQLLK